jgi:hypothetical protein
MAILRDISIILLVIIAMLLAMVPLLLIGSLVYGLGWLQRHENLPTWLGLVRAYVGLAQAYVDLGMAAVARPVIAVNSARAAFLGWRAAIVSVLKGEGR